MTCHPCAGGQSRADERAAKSQGTFSRVWVGEVLGAAAVGLLLVGPVALSPFAWAIDIVAGCLIGSP